MCMFISTPVWMVVLLTCHTVILLILVQELYHSFPTLCTCGDTVLIPAATPACMTVPVQSFLPISFATVIGPVWGNVLLLHTDLAQINWSRKGMWSGLVQWKLTWGSGSCEDINLGLWTPPWTRDSEANTEESKENAESYRILTALSESPYPAYLWQDGLQTFI